MSLSSRNDDTRQDVQTRVPLGSDVLARGSWYLVLSENAIEKGARLNFLALLASMKHASGPRAALFLLPSPASLLCGEVGSKPLFRPISSLPPPSPLPPLNPHPSVHLLPCSSSHASAPAVGEWCHKQLVCIHGRWAHGDKPTSGASGLCQIDVVVGPSSSYFSSLR